MRRDGRLHLSRTGRWPVALAIVALLMVPLQAHAAGGTGHAIANYSGLTAAQQATLRAIAQDTWKFYSVDVDPQTHLPMDNVTFAGGASTPTDDGRYTSAANVGVYLWAVVAANDLGLISRPDARAQLQATLSEIQRLKRFDGFLYQWYDTTTGAVIRNPGDTTDCAAEPPTTDNCYFISQVDNGWYVSGLIVVRDALPELGSLVDNLMAPVNFGIFYDNGPETSCNVYYNPTNPSDPNNYQPTGQMYGGYYVDQGPAGYHNGALYSDPRISAYIGMGLHQMPGNVWWRSWRELPPQHPGCPNDPDFSWQGQPQSAPQTGSWQTYTDPQSGQAFDVWEGHYTYPGTSLTYVPTWQGGMFEALMPNLVVPETSWGPTSFGRNDYQYALTQVQYATEALHYPVWGLSCASTPDDTGGYDCYGADGRVTPPGPLTQCVCSDESAVTPHASFLALDVLPQQAYDNIQALRTLYPGVYGADGFFDAVNPTTGSVGHRILVLDQSMIMAALDNALQNRALQRHFARSSVAWAAQTYLSMETLSIQ
jgi:Putative glucoamylase/Protein of unknown function (DUF3131)